VQGQKGFQFLIKWLGYDKPEDNTWEDEENCVGAHELIDKYWESIGGKPTLSAAKPRKRNVSTPSDRAVDTKKRRRRESSEESTPMPVPGKTMQISEWKPPTDLESWDDKVAAVETMEKTDSDMILVYLLW
jgi:chromobox protein 1